MLCINSAFENYNARYAVDPEASREQKFWNLSYVERMGFVSLSQFGEGGRNEDLQAIMCLRSFGFLF